MNKELEEAIKYLENLKPKLWIKYPDRFTGELKSDFILENAIQSVLNELKRLQEENSKLERANKTYINSIQSIAPVLLEDYIEKTK